MNQTREFFEGGFDGNTELNFMTKESDSDGHHLYAHFPTRHAWNEFRKGWQAAQSEQSKSVPVVREYCCCGECTSFLDATPFEKVPEVVRLRKVEADSKSVPVVGDVVIYQFRFFKWPVGCWENCSEQEYNDLRSGYEGRHLIVQPATSISAAELDALRKYAERLQKDAERMQKGLSDIAEWTDRYTTPGHPVSTIARAAIAQGKGE